MKSKTDPPKRTFQKSWKVGSKSMEKDKEKIKEKGNLYSINFQESGTGSRKKYAYYLRELWNSSPEIYELLCYSDDVEQVRDRLYSFLEKQERQLFDLDNNLHVMEKSTIRESIRVLRSIIGPVNEFHSEFSALEVLWKLANGKSDPVKEELSYGFLLEFIHIFRGIMGKAHIYREKPVSKGIPNFLKLKGRHAARARMVLLDKLGEQVGEYFSKYNSGLENKVIKRRAKNRKRILNYFNWL